jgi:hypothetical protein
MRSIGYVGHSFTPQCGVGRGTAGGGWIECFNQLKNKIYTPLEKYISILFLFFSIVSDGL